MSNLWWLQPGWTDTRCADCGRKIWPEGDPDHGVCFDCFNARWDRDNQPQPSGPSCDICGKHDAVTGTNGYGVCSKECSDEAAGREPAGSKP